LKSYLTLLLLAGWCAASGGQASQTPADPVAEELFPPDLVMQYHQEINLTESQSRAIRDEIQKAQAKFVDMLWDRPADEVAVLAQVDKVLDRERVIKKTQMSLLVRIRNLLTEAQQSKLMELRRKPS